MNIIISEELHLKLQKNIVSTIEFGSALKGEKTADSDSDLLHIVESADWWTSSPVANQHLLQYKTENEDHIYCNAHTFVKSLLDGDTTIFLEMHKYNGLDNTCLAFLNKYDFIFYRSLRAYLGISRRDIKDTRKLWKDKENQIRKINKKLKFAEQGLSFVVEHLISKSDSIEDFDFFIEEYNRINTLELFKNGEKYITLTIDSEFSLLDDISRKYNELLDYVRKYLNKYIESGFLEKTFDKDTFLTLISELNANISVSNVMVDCEKEVMTYFYNSYMGEV